MMRPFSMTDMDDWVVVGSILDNAVVLEAKGQGNEQDQVKRKFLAEWVDAVNAHGGFGCWRWNVALQPGALKDVLIRHSRAH